MIHFANPWNLLLLILPLGLLIAGITKNATARKYNKTQSISFSSLVSIRAAGKSLSHRFAHLPYALIILTLVLIIIAAARPQQGVDEVAGKRDGVAIEMLFDISSSMDISIDSGDAEFDRITAAKKVCRDFILGNSKDLTGREDDIIGLITFARYADTACPMTTGLEALSSIVDDLEVETRPNEDGTAFGDALILAAAHLMKIDKDSDSHQHNAIKSKIIILLTDGDNNCGKHLPAQAAALAQKWGIKIYAIFLGDQPSTVNENNLQLTPSQQQLTKICERTGGICRMVNDYDSLHAVYSEIDNLEKSKITLFTDTVYRELFPHFTLAAALCLALSILLNATLLRRTP
jgi:Ca-activated chloride channel family protein